MSIQFLLPMGTILGEEPASSLLCGFAFAFDRHTKSFAFNFNAYSSTWSSGMSVSLLFKFITNLFDQWEFLTQERVLSLFKDKNSDLHSIFTVQATVYNFQYKPKCFHDMPLHDIVRIPVSFVMKYCPISTTFRNTAPIQNLLNLSCCDNFSIRSPYLCKRRSLLAGSSQSKRTYVLIALSTIDCPITTSSLPVLSWRDSFSSHISATAP